MENLLKVGNSYHEVVLLAIVAGLASHQGFRKYEPTISSFLGVFCFLQAIVFLKTIIISSFALKNLVSGALFVATFDVVYLTVLGLSIVLYRVYFHPLRRFPGPKLSRISKFVWFYRVRGGHFYKHVEEMHKMVLRES